MTQQTPFRTVRSGTSSAKVQSDGLANGLLNDALGFFSAASRSNVTLTLYRMDVFDATHSNPSANNLANARFWKSIYPHHSNFVRTVPANEGQITPRNTNYTQTYKFNKFYQFAYLDTEFANLNPNK